MLSVQDIPLYNSTLIAPKVLNKDDHSTIPTASQRSLSTNQREGYKNSYSLIPLIPLKKEGIVNLSLVSGMSLTDSDLI